MEGEKTQKACTDTKQSGRKAIQMQTTLDDLAKAPFPHPMLNESLAEVALESLGKPNNLP